MPSPKSTYKKRGRINAHMHASQGGWGDLVHPWDAGLDPRLFGPAVDRTSPEVTQAEAIFDFLTSWKTRFTAGRTRAEAKDIRETIEQLQRESDEDLVRAIRALDTTTTAEIETAIFQLLREQEFPRAAKVPVDRIMLRTAKLEDVRRALPLVVHVAQPGRPETKHVESDFRESVRAFCAEQGIQDSDKLFGRWRLAVLGREAVDPTRNARNASKR